MQPHTLLFAFLFLAVSTARAGEPPASPDALPVPVPVLNPAAGGDASTPGGEAAPAARTVPEAAAEVMPAPAEDSVPRGAAESAPAATGSADARRFPVPGDCAIFREGGEGYILKAPTYYLKGKIAEIYRRPHYMKLCPDPGRTRANYRRDDWLRLAEAYPCVSDPARSREIEVVRVKVEVSDWDTPWSVQHGRNGWLMRGHFLDIELKEGVVVDIDGTLLEYCED